MSDLVKILITALVASFFAVCVTEPVKIWLRRRQMRWSLYFEITQNYGALLAQAEMAKHDNEMKEGIGQRFAMSYKRLAYDMVLNDPATFYGLGHEEAHWIELLYRDYEHVLNGRFDSEDTRLNNAEFVTYSVINNLKNRHMSKRLALKVSPGWMKEHFRQQLPLANYIDVKPPKLPERFHRSFDRVQYRIWRSFYVSRAQ